MASFCWPETLQGPALQAGPGLVAAGVAETDVHVVDLALHPAADTETPPGRIITQIVEPGLIDSFGVLIGLDLPAETHLAGDKQCKVIGQFRTGAVGDGNITRTPELSRHQPVSPLIHVEVVSQCYLEHRGQAVWV